MELRELGYFIAVYEARSVTAAARRCFISQPSVSSALASLEHELGVSLFVRDRRGATPTDAAERLYPMARRITDEARGLKATLADRPKHQAIILAMPRSLDAARTSDILCAAARDPDVVLKVVEHGDKRADVRVIERSAVGKSQRFTRLFEEPFVVALPPSHPLARKKSVRSSDLVTERVVERCHCEYSRHFRRGARRVEIAAVAHSEEWALMLVAAGLGIALLPEGSTRGNTQIVVRKIDDVALTREMGLIVDDEPGSTAILAMVDRIVRACHGR